MALRMQSSISTLYWYLVTDLQDSELIVPYEFEGYEEASLQV
jgi:hypothetical protein